MSEVPLYTAQDRRQQLGANKSPAHHTNFAAQVETTGYEPFGETRSTNPRNLALPHSGWPTFLKLTCWISGTTPSALSGTRARSHQIGERLTNPRRVCTGRRTRPRRISTRKRGY